MKQFPQRSYKLCELLGIKYPVIQAGMVWVSGAKLASAAANCGLLGVIGAASMRPDLLKLHIQKAKKLTNKEGVLAVNVPLLYHQTEKQLQTALDEGIKIFITSAGSPKKYTSWLQDHGAKVIHVTSTPLLAKKCEDAGVDAIVAEGFEAGGHNGRDEITTMSLIPQVVEHIKIPVIAAGGIGSGQGILASLALGASGAQLGTRFVATQESSAHKLFKQAVSEARFNSTQLVMKDLVPVRLLKNDFFWRVRELEKQCAPKEELSHLLGKGRAEKGMHLGDMSEGELEIGQIAGLIRNIPTVKECVDALFREYDQSLNEFQSEFKEK